jgi:hypothetical protein
MSAVTAQRPEFALTSERRQRERRVSNYGGRRLATNWWKHKPELRKESRRVVNRGVRP